MTAKKKSSDRKTGDDSLRNRAEAFLQTRPSEAPTLPTSDVQALVYELNVHQMELEIQNEELRQSQLELACLSDRFSDLFDFAPVGYVTLDLAGIVLEANLAAAAMLGAERKRLVGSNISNWIDPADQDDVYLNRQAVIADPARQTCEVTMRKADGAALSARLESIAVAGDRGWQSRTVLIDITEQKRVEKAALESQAHTKAILASLAAHIAVVDGSGIVLAVNPAWERFANENDGAPNRCNVGANYLQTCLRARGDNSAEARTVAEGLRAILEGDNNFFSLEYPCHSATENRWFLLQATRLSGDARGAVMAHMDITHRVVAEEISREREGRIRAILNTAADAIITIDAHGFITAANPATKKMFGYTEEELLGQNVNLLMPSPYHEEHDTYLKNYRKTGKAKIIGIGREAFARRKDGTVFPIDLAVSEITELGLFTGIIRDISDRKSLEQEVLKVAEEEKLQISRELHDGLGAHLSGVELLCDVLETKLAAKSLPEVADLENISSLVRDAVAQARSLAHGLHAVGPGPEDLMESLRNLAHRINRDFEPSCDFDCPHPVMVKDQVVANHLFRIAQEAVNNALKHANATHLTICLARTEERLILGIKDNGGGMPKSLEPKKGIGLRTMQYRAGVMNGSLMVQKPTTGGTEIVCTVTLSAL